MRHLFLFSALLLAGCSQTAPDEASVTVADLAAVGEVWTSEAGGSGDLPTGDLLSLAIDEGGHVLDRGDFAPDEPGYRMVYVRPETYLAVDGGPFTSEHVALAVEAATAYGVAPAITRFADPYADRSVGERRLASAARMMSDDCEPFDTRITCYGPPPEPATFTVEKGDVVAGWRSSGNVFGHSGVVYRGGDPRDVRTINMEARGWAGQAAGVVTPADEVAEVPFKFYFLTPDVYRLRVARAPISSSRRAASADWAKTQDPDRYAFPSPLWDMTRWYCSKLNWAALKHGANYDLGPGWTVGSYNPSDLWTTNALQTVYRQGT